MFLKSPPGRLKRSCVHLLCSIQKVRWENGRVIHQATKGMEMQNHMHMMTTLTNYLSPRRRGSSSPLLMKVQRLQDLRGSPTPRNGQRPENSLCTPAKKRVLNTTPLHQRSICLTCSEHAHHRSPHMIFKPPPLMQRKTSDLE